LLFNLDDLAMLKPIMVPFQLALLGAVMGLLSACTDLEKSASNDSTRWYTAAQLAQGQVIFADHCAACHGLHGEGVADWKTVDENGFYPAPPINGTAHAWHHSLKVLLRTINMGGEPLGGSMPAFQGRLTAQEQRLVIAAFQHYWPDNVYAQWHDIDRR
jgi:mono/diheme cytochrome c family protein